MQSYFGGYRYQNIIILRVFVITSRPKYRFVSNSITRRRFDRFDTTTIMVYLRTEIIVKLNTYAVFPSVQVHDEVFWFRVPEFHSTFVAMRVVRELLRVEIHVRHVMSRLRGHVQCIIVL